MTAPKPAFVIVGVNYQDGMMVLASDTVSEADLHSVAEEYQLDSATGRARPTVSKHSLTAQMRDVKQATGRTFAEAMSNLFHQWHPSERDHRSIHDRMPRLNQGPLGLPEVPLSSTRPGLR